MRFVLVHSPLVGPTTWAAVAHQLRRGGEQVVVPDLRPAVTGSPPCQPAVWRTVGEAMDRLPGRGPVVLVGHSRAGPLLPGIADACDESAHALVFVDSGLPQSGTSWFERAPGDVADHVRRLETTGLLPPWESWFEPGAIEALVPDPSALEQFRRELPRLPLAFLDEPTPRSTWTGPCAYLLLSDGYLSDADQARGNGWPVLEQRSHHLAMLTDPADVAVTLAQLSRLLVTDASRNAPGSRV